MPTKAKVENEITTIPGEVAWMVLGTALAFMRSPAPRQPYCTTMVQGVTWNATVDWTNMGVNLERVERIIREDEYNQMRTEAIGKARIRISEAKLKAMAKDDPEKVKNGWLPKVEPPEVLESKEVLALPEPVSIARRFYSLKELQEVAL